MTLSTKKPEGYHSPIGASSMHRWGNCPGSIKLSKGLKSISSAYADEGTKAHEAAAAMLNFEYKSDFKYTLPDELKQSVGLYIETIGRDTAGVFGFKIFIEQWCDLSRIHKDLGGTADCIIHYPKEKLLRVYDYKHGAGVSVEVEQNEQLMYYALGALLETKATCKEVEIVIVQPRCDHPDGVVRRWRFDTIELLDFAADLKDKAQATTNPNAPLKPGDWCRWCPAAGICPELNQKALALAKTEFSPALSYDPNKLSQILSWLPVLEGWIKSTREFAYGEALHGRCPPGYKLVQKRATRKWRDEALVSKALSQNFQESIIRDCFTEPELKSPAQLEKVIGKTDHAKKFLEEHTVSESSGTALAEESDKRPPLKLDAKSEFTALAGTEEIDW